MLTTFTLLVVTGGVVVDKDCASACVLVMGVCY